MFFKILSGFAAIKSGPLTRCRRVPHAEDRGPRLRPFGHQPAGIVAAGFRIPAGSKSSASTPFLLRSSFLPALISGHKIAPHRCALAVGAKLCGTSPTRKPGRRRVFFVWLTFGAGLTGWRGSGPIGRRWGSGCCCGTGRRRPSRSRGSRRS